MAIMQIRSISLFMLIFATAIVLSTGTAQPACDNHLGVEDGSIPDSHIWASSEWDYDNTDQGTKNARLNRIAQPGTAGAWIARTNNENGNVEWIQAKLGGLKRVTGVKIQGRQDCCPQWVTKFKVAYANDGEHWTFVQIGNNQADMIFNGNMDKNTVVTALFPEPVQAHSFRIFPTEWHQHISMRFELIGCEVELNCRNRLGIEDDRISDSQITASSELDSSPLDHGPSNARLNRQAQSGTIGGWHPKYDSTTEWIQAALGVFTRVTGVLIQGRQDCCPHWVKKFKVQYSNDGQNWAFVQQTDNQRDMIFNGNTDQNTVVTRHFPNAVEASFIRIRPTEWNIHICMRFELLGCEVCQGRLGIEDGRISDSQMTASSEYDSNHGPSNARLNRAAQSGTSGGWNPEYQDTNPWIQAALGVPTRVTGVLIQGRQDCCPQWVTKFKVQYSNDGQNWAYVLQENQQDMIFNGNTDQNTVVTRYFPIVVEASFIRIYPTEWSQHISMRFELIGCTVVPSFQGAISVRRLPAIEEPRRPPPPPPSMTTQDQFNQLTTRLDEAFMQIDKLKRLSLSTLKLILNPEEQMTHNSETNDTCRILGTAQTPALSCYQLKEACQVPSGIYYVRGGSDTFYKVYCDMETLGGGWTRFGKGNMSSLWNYHNEEVETTTINIFTDSDIIKMQHMHFHEFKILTDVQLSLQQDNSINPSALSVTLLPSFTSGQVRVTGDSNHDHTRIEFDSQGDHIECFGSKEHPQSNRCGYGGTPSVGSQSPQLLIRSAFFGPRAKGSSVIFRSKELPSRNRYTWMGSYYYVLAK
ncbi:uncharacterized protein [Amphiura filiformis]|uniref:uncharacterized protein n=1 Tax=Amphiura filiformis TaxID=82378 RepID=UPI003B20CC32